MHLKGQEYGKIKVECLKINKVFLMTSSQNFLKKMKTN